MKRILTYLTIMIIGLGFCAYKLSDMKDGYVTYVTEDSIATKAIKGLEKTIDQDGKVDFDKAKELLLIVGERHTSIFYVDLFYKVSIFFMFLYFLSGIYYEVKGPKSLAKPPSKSAN